VVGRLMDQKHMMVDYYIIVVSEFFGKQLRIDLVALHNIEGCAMLGLCTNLGIEGSEKYQESSVFLKARNQRLGSHLESWFIVR